MLCNAGACSCTLWFIRVETDSPALVEQKVKRENMTS